MKKKALTIAALWLALIALAVIYTDRNAETWVYDVSSIPWILETEADAIEAQRRADEELERERAAAYARRDAGKWGKADEYASEILAMPTIGWTYGLNLMWGEYEATVRYESQEPMTLRAVSAGRQAFIEDGEALLPAAPQGAQVSMRFTLTDSTEGVMLACDVPENAKVWVITVRRVCQRVCSPDLLAFAALAGGALTWLLVLSWDERRVGVKRRRDAMILLCAVLFASAPALLSYICHKHDLYFHLNRIEGIASALRCGQFPVRIHASTLLGFGYAAPEFYPELFFYLPAVLRNLGVSLVVSVQVMEILINLATALICYASVRHMFGSREVSLCASVLYTLSVYRLINLYTRAAYGEALAMIFFPLLIAAAVDVLTRDERRWPLMALAMTGIFMSHLLSTLFAIGFCALAALCCLPRLVREPRRILACVRAAGLTVLCSLWFVIPFLQYMQENISTDAGTYTALSIQAPGILLTAFPNGTGYTTLSSKPLSEAMGTQPGAPLLIGCALLLLARYMRSRDEALSESAQGRLPMTLLCMGALAALMSTKLIPWDRLVKLPSPLNSPFVMIQFPWRLVGVAAPLMSIAAACGYLAKPRLARAGAVLALVMSVVCAGLVLQEQMGKSICLPKEGYLDSRITQREYVYEGTERSTFSPGAVHTDGTNAQVTSYEKRGTNLTLTIAGMADAQYLELPVNYYPGYRVQVNGEERSVCQGDFNVVRVYGTWTDEAQTVRLWFEEPLLWRAAELASLAGFALLALLCARKRT